jgi:hypothetical protein
MEQQIVLIDEMTKENPDATIRDFLDLLNDIEAIENAPKISLPIRVQERGSNGKFLPFVWKYV